MLGVTQHEELCQRVVALGRLRSTSPEALRSACLEDLTVEATKESAPQQGGRRKEPLKAVP